MKHYDDLFGRFMAAGFDAWSVSLTIAETLAASQSVIGARVTMLGAGLDYPGHLPFAEFGRLIPEKVAAFGKANAAAARTLRRGGVPDWGTATGMDLLDWWQASIKATGAWWAPIHAQATANARRLA
jgi:hypothetical protein